MQMTRRLFTSLLAATGLASRATAQPLAFEMPPEWEPHERTFMQWPTNVDVYGPGLLRRVQQSIAEIARAIAEYEEVVILVGDDSREQARSLLGEQIETWNVPTDDLWCRDSGPAFVRLPDGELAVSQIQFNGWGQKQEHGHDKLIARTVAQRLGLDYIETGLIGEQGGLEHNGAGLVMAHASSWVNPNRNSGNHEEVAEKILNAVGGRKMIWAPGIKGADITDYHIDALARFVSPGKVLIQIADDIDREDPWSKAAHETLDILKSATTIDGKPLEIVRLPEPVNIRSRQRDFVASYVNYYVCNGAVISSQFGDKEADGQAREILQGLYPSCKVVALNTDPIGASGGGIHCATQQQPTSTEAR